MSLTVVYKWQPTSEEQKRLDKDYCKAMKILDENPKLKEKCEVKK